MSRSQSESFVSSVPCSSSWRLGSTDSSLVPRLYHCGQCVKDARLAKGAWQFLRESDAPTPAWCITVRGWLQPDVIISGTMGLGASCVFFQSLHTAVDPFRDVRMAVPWSPVLTTSQHADCLLGGSGKGPQVVSWSASGVSVHLRSSGQCILYETASLHFYPSGREDRAARRGDRAAGPPPNMVVFAVINAWETVGCRVCFAALNDKASQLVKTPAPGAVLRPRGLGPGVFAHIAALSAFRGPSSLTGSCGSLRTSSREAGRHKSRTSQPSVHVSRSSSLKGCWGS